MPRRPLLRAAGVSDVPALVAMQETAAVADLSHIFPQDEFPFPRADTARAWTAEIESAEVDVFVAAPEPGRVEGFAALRADELLHFGTAALSAARPL